MKQAESNDAPLIRAVGDADVTIRVLARNTIEEAALTRQRLQRRQASIPSRRRHPRPIVAKGIRLRWQAGKSFLPGTAELETVLAVSGDGQRSLAASPVAADQGPAAPPDALWNAFRNTSVQVLTRGLVDPDVRARLAAVDALELIGEEAGPAAPALVQSLGDSDRHRPLGRCSNAGEDGSPSGQTAVPGLARCYPIRI